MTNLPTDKWVGVFAHPDDEWLAGWPIFQRMDLRLGVIFFVGDNRLDGQTDHRSWRPRLTEVLNSLGIELLGCLECPPDFYRLPRSERSIWRDRLAAILERTLITGHSRRQD